MKLISYAFLSVYLFTIISCCNQEKANEHKEAQKKVVEPTASTGNFGEIITREGAIESSQLPELLADKEVVNVKLIGKVDAVCQMSGCWMDMVLEEDKTVHVTFQDEAFLLPKDAADKTAVIEGVATFEEIPVELLKRMAEDEGKSKEEIDAITEPLLEYSFVAKGVILY
jgi:hypothetical protein